MTAEPWWDRLYDPAKGDTHDAHPPEEDADGVDQADDEDQPKPRWWTRPHTPRAPRPWEKPREQPKPPPGHPPTAPQGIHPGRVRRLKWTAYNGTAAATGWGLYAQHGLTQLLADCARDTHSDAAAIVTGVAVCCAAAHFIDHPTRGWWPPLAWVMRIPLATCVLALLLYTTPIGVH